MKKILLVDDSALMRNVFCDIINSDSRFSIADQASDGAAALELLKTKTYDAVVLDVNMPRMDGIQLLKELRKNHIAVRVLMASTVTQEGAKITMDALELGALDFIHKPDWSYRCKDDTFKSNLLTTLEAVCNSRLPDISVPSSGRQTIAELEKVIRSSGARVAGNKIVAIAISTGGPKSLQSVIPLLPADLDAPVVVVQHMPEGFTASLAARLDALSDVNVVEAKEDEELKKGCVYIAKAGSHLNLVKSGRTTRVHYTQEPHREGVRPCANYMYESLAGCDYDRVICVVMTGMGADGTAGIRNLKASDKNVFVITQEGESCVVNGMPKACVKAGLSDSEVRLGEIAQEIILHVGVKRDGC